MKVAMGRVARFISGPYRDRCWRCGSALQVDCEDPRFVTAHCPQCAHRRVFVDYTDDRWL